MTDTTNTVAMTPAHEAYTITAEHIRAAELHRRIMTEAEVAGSAIISMAGGLKEMRDTRLYTELGYETFEAYVEQAVGIKQRQAYNYIAVLEKLPAQVLQSTAHIGITKLELLTQVPALDRGEFIDDNDLEGMTVREMREKIEELTGRCEQLSFDLEQATSSDAGSDDNNIDDSDHNSVDLDNISRQISALRAENEQLMAAQNDALTTAREEGRKEAEKEAAKKIKDVKATAAAEAERKAKKDAEKQIEEAREAAIKEAEERSKQLLSVVEEERQQAIRKAADLENQLKVAGDNETLRFSILFDEFQADFNRLHGVVLKVRQDGRTEDADKFEAALLKALDMLKAKVGG